MERLNHVTYPSLLGIIAFISLLFSFSFLLFFRDIGPTEHNVPGSDYSDIYEPMALNILAGKGFFAEVKTYISAPPGYAFFLVPLFFIANFFSINPLGLIVSANTFFIALSLCFFFLFVEGVFNRSIAFIASALWASYPLHLWFIKNPNTEIPFLLILFMALWWLVSSWDTQRVRDMFIIGVLLGIAMLIRPIALLLPFFVCIPLYWERHRLSRTTIIKTTVALLCGAYLTITPWIWYAWATTGHFVPLSSAGPVATKYGLSYTLVGKGVFHHTLPEDVQRLMEYIRYGNITSHADLFLFMGKSFIQHPVTVSHLLIRKMGRAWYGTYSLWWEKEIALMQLPYLTSALIGMWLVLMRFPKKRSLIMLLLFIIVYFWGMTFMTLSIVRYMVPAMALVIIFSAIALNRFFRYIFYETH